MAVRVGFLGAGLIAHYHARSIASIGPGASTGPGASADLTDGADSAGPGASADLTDGADSAGPGAFLASIGPGTSVGPGAAADTPDPAGVVAVVHDPAAERAAAFAERFGARVVGSAAEVIEAADAVYVCTWTSEHRRLVEAAVGAGRPVFCEKPLAPDLAGAESMVATVAAAGVAQQVGLALRASPGFHLLRALVQDPAAGRVVSVVFRDDQQLPVGGFYGSDWRIDRSRAGAGTLLEHSIHDVDIIEWLVGPIARLSAMSAGLHGHPGIEDTVAVSFSLVGGATGVLTSVWHDLPGRLSERRVEVFCERGRFWGEGNLAEVVGWEYQAGRGHQREGAGQVEELRRRGLTPPENADAAFLRAVASGRPAWPDFSVALRAHRLVDAAYRSAAAGGEPVDCRPSVG